jgi:WD40 repeat protein
MPGRLARVVGTTKQRVFSVIFSESAGAVIANTRGSELTSISTTAGVRSLAPHTFDTSQLEPAAQGGRFAAYGASGVVEIWSSSPVARTHVFDTQAGLVSHLSFVPEGDDFVTSGKDGRLVGWTAAGEPRVIHQLDQPIESFVLAARTRAMVVAARDGSLWRIDGDGRASQLAPGGAKITRLLALPDGVSVCIGRANGELIVVETTSWQQTRLPRAGDAIRDLAVTGDGRTIAVATGDDTIRLGVRHGEAWTDAATTWTSLAVRARRLALTHDGLLVAVCTDGTVWIYSAARRTWLCLLVGTSDLTHAIATSDGTTGVVFDADGHIISIDLTAVRKILDTQ